MTDGAKPGRAPVVSHARTGSTGRGGGSSGGGQIKMGGATGSTTHTINEDERTEFTRHINAVLLGDADIGDRLPFPTDTFQVCCSIFKVTIVLVLTGADV